MYKILAHGPILALSDLGSTPLNTPPEIETNLTDLLRHRESKVQKTVKAKYEKVTLSESAATESSDLLRPYTILSTTIYFNHTHLAFTRPFKYEIQAD